ncbi:gliding motility-associated protein GldL [Catalinimonas alkaloidigena]|uniref:type IX secretion system motor protein PorL/GldL n=1 Tax=Catalinimonas alkaloidigena TaxID=1075417 RepID=UPI002404C5C3|nr:gliding motility protein GldL [Catalinimonas alkaloidigena]MDF9794781.1 gliding motility-associated protein GldL [Catalinimonas alkaloidigena]
MSKKKGGFSELLYGTIMPKIYGIGAAVVIVGAMFKILHLPGAGIMLGVGLTTEAIIFLFSAFEPKHNEYDWSLVYPELMGDTEASDRRKISNGKSNGDSVTKKLDAMLESSKVGPELIDSLGRGMKNLSDSVTKMGSLSNAALATDEYAKNVKVASSSLSEMNKSYSTAIQAMSSMSDASKDTKEYHVQVQQVTKNLASLNSVYELELQDANSHLKAMNKFYSNLSSAMENVSEASKDAESFKNNFASLNNNISSLNRVYGNMLSAMKA